MIIGTRADGPTVLEASFSVGLALCILLFINHIASWKITVDPTPIEVEIEHEGQIVRAAMTNKSLYTNVAIQKTGYAEVMPGQNIRYTISVNANNSTTTLTSFYWRDALPVEAVRLAKITTGTYNAPGNY